MLDPMEVGNKFIAESSQQHQYFAKSVQSDSMK